MNKKKIIASIIPLILIAAVFVLLPRDYSADLDPIDEVDIGDETSEAGHMVDGWGPIEPFTHGGGWGGAAGGILDTGDTNCRVTWAPSIGDNDPSATLVLSTGEYVGTTLWIIALDGSADDSFDVSINGEIVYSYSAQPGPETWYEHGIPVHIKPGMTVVVTITATGAAWSGIGYWGQLGIAYVALLGFESGYDEYGYNYQAHMFNGLYSDYDRVHGGDGEDIHLMMKWSDTWLSNQDRNGDGELDRGDPPDYGSSAADGAWLTNHMRGRDENGKKWSYFVKIVYPTGGPVDENNDGFDDNLNGEIIWGAFVVVKEVESGSGCIFHAKPEGWGAL